MSEQTTTPVLTDTATKNVRRLGFWTAIGMTLSTMAALGLGATTPPRSGSNCPNQFVDECITAPFTDAAAFVPRDYYWMYPAFLMVLLFVVLVVCIHYYADPDKKVFSHIALCFAVISAIPLSIDYFIQLAVMQPSLLQGEVAGLAPFSQYNPHGIFIALEDVGYLLMAVAFLFVAPVFDRRERIERILRWLFIVSFILAAGSLLIMVLLYGPNLGYRYEVVVIIVDWLTLIVAGLLLSLVFRRDRRPSRIETD